jgi:NHLM bacteriocin system ABC transporter peptidase/ATP-binding protein
MWTLANLRSPRRKCPTILQMEAVECGAAALAMILAHYNKWVPLEALRIECGVSRDGSKASNIARAARKHHMEVKAFSLTVAGLSQKQLFPCIVFWNFNHFIVVEGMSETDVYINDPASGASKISLDEFGQGFTGIALTFKTTDEFVPGGAPKGIWGSLNDKLQGNYTAICYVVIASLGLVIPGIVIPVYSKIFIDDILLKGLDSWYRPLIVAIVITAIFMALFTWLQQYFLVRVQTKLALTSSGKFINHLIRLPMPFFGQRYAGDVTARVETNSRIAQVLSGQLTISFFNLFSALFFAVVMFSYDATLASICIGLTLISLTSLRFSAVAREDLSRSLLKDEGKLLGTSMSGLSMIETLKSIGGESDFFQKWAGYQSKVVQSRQRLEVYNQLFSLLSQLINHASVVIILGFGGYKVMKGEISLGTLIAFQTLLQSFNSPIGSLMSAASEVQQLKGDLSKVDDVINYQVDDRSVPISSADVKLMENMPEKFKGMIEITNLSFGFSPLEAPLIKNFSLTIEPGKKVALVGKSGSGKSTIAKLITGLYQPWTGEIRIDGHNINDIPKPLLARSISSVDQEITIFSGTVKENIALWDHSIPESNIVNAAIDAGIHDVISSLEGGYDAKLTESGGNLSGGQAQRLEIAGALVKMPSVLVLDEATSALDPLTEQTIGNNIRLRGITSITIAHRLSTIRDADEIIVLHRGEIVQRGNHDSLLAQEGHYKDLVTSE